MKIRLPATSANLGPGFDAMALALELFLEIEAVAGPEFSITATGRNRSICSGLNRNLLIQTYESVLLQQKQPIVPLTIRMQNGIPIGMGCGSSAAVRLGAVALASHFGQLGWNHDQMLACAAQVEGHPDNVAACWRGGLTVAAAAPELPAKLACVSIPPPPGWRAMLVLPDTPVATSKARSMLPEKYEKQDVVTNVQCAALLTAAFALGRADLLQLATRDRLHQPYRMQLCPLLPALLPLAGQQGVLSVTLSGAGPAVLLLVESAKEGPGDFDDLKREVLSLAQCPVEILVCDLSRTGAAETIAS